MESIKSIPADLLKDVQLIMNKTEGENVVQDSPMPGFGKILSPDEIEAKNLLSEVDGPSNEKIKKSKSSDAENGEDEDDEPNGDDEDDEPEKKALEPKKKAMEPLKKKKDSNIKLSGKKEKIDVDPKLPDVQNRIYK